MNEIAGNQRAYTESGPWDRLGSVLRITVAVIFLAITIVFIATAQNGLVSAVEDTPSAQAATTDVPADGAAAAAN